jgi:hypothetical protein
MLRRFRLGLLALAGAAALAAVGCGGTSGPTMIATVTDFAPYASWESFNLGDAPLPGHPPGPRTGFRNAPAPAGAKKYPVGTIIVKQIQTNGSTDITTWDLFGMVKRGGDYNEGGAVDWEFFILHLNDAMVPSISERGTAPADPSTDGGADSYGTAMNGQTCNVCHGMLGSDQTDHILSPLLQPGTQ